MLGPFSALQVCTAKTAGGVQFGIFWTVGQICSATSRVLLEESIADKFLDRLKRWTETVVVGDPLNPDTRLGPVVSEGQFQKVLAFIEVRFRLTKTRLLFPNHVFEKYMPLWPWNSYFLRPAIVYRNLNLSLA